MLEQISNILQFDSFFTSSGAGKTGLTVTVDVYRGASQVVTAGSATEIGGGFYTYQLSSGSVTNKNNYRAVFKTTDTTVDQQHIPALWVVGSTWIQYLDTALSSLALAATALSSAIWTNTLATNLGTTNSTVSTNLDVAVSTRAPSSTAVSNVNYTSARAAKLDNLDTTISSRSSHTAADVWASATRTLTSYGTLIADIWSYVTRTLTSAGSTLTAADVWSYAQRIITGVSPNITIDSLNGETSINMKRGDTISVSFTDLGSLQNYTSLWFTVKHTSVDDADEDSIIQIKKNFSGSGDGLLYFNQDVATDSTKGYITILDQTAGNISVNLDASVSKSLSPSIARVYDVQLLASGVITTLTEGKVNIYGDRTRSIS
jgi:hypothetical protein